MVKNRVHFDKEVDPAILCAKLEFKTSGRGAKNRLLKSALSDRLASYVHSNPKSTGIPGEQLVNIYSKFGHGGFGTIVTGNTSVHPNHLEAVGNLVICQENESAERQRQFSKLVNAAKSDGSLVIMQLAHPGKVTPALINKQPFLVSKGDGKVLGKEEIRLEVVDRFVYAARHAHLYGFDGVQIHAAYANLLAQFLSFTENRRTDKYGGSVENRFRLIEEIYTGIRKQLLPSTGFVVGIKLDFVSPIQKSQQSTDFIYMLKQIDALGFDFVELAGGRYEKVEGQIATVLRPEIHQTQIFLTGGFKQTDWMVRAVEVGDANGIGLGRAVTAEPDLARKILTKQVQSVSLAHYNQDFDTMLNMSLTQMVQAGQTAWEECEQNATYGIADFSDKQEADHFHEQLKRHLKEVEKEEQKTGRPFVGVFGYKPL